MRVVAFVSVLMGVVFAAGCGREAARDATRQAAAELQRSLSRSAPGYVRAHHDGPQLWKTIRRFYADRRYQPAWIEGTKPRPQLDSLLQALDGAAHDGLDPELYDLGPLSTARGQVKRRLLRPSGFEPEQIAPLDLRLTAAWLAYASDLSNGVTARPHADPMWKIKPRNIDLLPILKNAIAGNRVEESLRGLAPPHEEYRRLADAHERYLAIQREGGWPTVRSSLTLKRGQRSPHLSALARRLAASGDLDAAVALRRLSTYDGELQAAVRRFQQRHGLQASGVVGRETVAAMNVPIAARVRQLELNMERWRWFPRDLGARHIRVNVPEYRLEVWENGRVAFPMTVVVGAKDKPTPIFSDVMTTVVFSPYWNVPSSIAADETLPALIEDPEYLARNNLEVVSTSGEVIAPESVDWMAAQEAPDAFPYRFRQRPGTTNSLGLVKFLFPNDFDVYLHDTPAQSLFRRSFRALSHGCVRVQDPVRLAEYLLENSRQWNGTAIRNAMTAGTEQHVKLPEPIRVHLMYWTARVDGDGTVHFFQDIYGHDARQSAEYRSRLERVKRRKAAEARRAGDVSEASAPHGGASPGRRGGARGQSPLRDLRAGRASR